MSKYEATGIEAELQPGGEVGVLRNRLDLITVEDIDDAEAELLEGLYTRVFSQSLQQLTFSDIKAWHRQWLGNLYDWAGQLRSVNVSKEDFHFTLVEQLPLLASKFEEDYLLRFPQLSEFILIL